MGDDADELKNLLDEVDNAPTSFAPSPVETGSIGVGGVIAARLHAEVRDRAADRRRGDATDRQRTSRSRSIDDSHPDTGVAEPSGAATGGRKADDREANDRATDDPSAERLSITRACGFRSGPRCRSTG